MRQPRRDDELAAGMRATAAQLAAEDDRLDFSPASVEVIDLEMKHRPDAGRVTVLGAYVGEVLVHHAREMCWARDPKDGTPRVALGAWLTDPFEQVERRSKPGAHPDDTLRQYVGDLIEYAADPTDATARRLGWSTRFGGPTPWEWLAQAWRRRRRFE